MDTKNLLTNTQELEILANHLFVWCSKIEKDGGGWDEWDYFYKDASDEIRKTEVFKIIQKYKTIETCEKTGFAKTICDCENCFTIIGGK